MQDDPETTIARLVALHGEGGAAPTASDWRQIFASGDGPVTILNLLAFKPSAPTANGATTGAEAYRRYIEGVGSAFQRVGGERLHFGAVRSQFGLAIDGVWDAAILTRYPSVAALAEMWLDPVFIEAHRHRESGLARSHVMLLG